MSKKHKHRHQSKAMQSDPTELLKALEETIVDPTLRRKLDHATALVLNADYSPVSVLPLSTSIWKDTIKNVFKQKVFVLEEYEDIAIRSPSVTFRMPSIVVSKVYQKPKRKVQFVKNNVFMRDGFVCQYCGNEFSPSELTYDHLVPRLRGGKTNWTNIVTSCETCNADKGHKSFNEWTSPLGLNRPLNMPIVPTYGLLEARFREQKLVIPDERWKDYLMWRGPLWVKDPSTNGIRQIQGLKEDIEDDVGFS